MLNGQKTWTTRGAFCTHLFGLFRTDPEAERHKGLTYLLVPLDADGVTVRGFGRLDGDEGFAEVFFDDAFVADDALPGGVVLGEVGPGLVGGDGDDRRRSAASRCARPAASSPPPPGSSTSGTGAGRARRAERRRAARPGRPGLDGGRGLPAADAADGDGHGRGPPAGAESSSIKIWWSELDVELHETALDLLGADAELEGPGSKG